MRSLKFSCAIAGVAVCLGVNGLAAAASLKDAAKNGATGKPAVGGVNALAAAASLRGTVRNGTTGKPAAGDEVVLMSLAGNPTEIGRVKTDKGGRFSFSVDESQQARLIRVIHQGAAYHSPAPSGADPVEIEVYDVASQLDDLFATWNVRLQTEGDALQVIEEIKVRNASDPPRTLMNNRPLEIQLPADADVLAGKVQIGAGKPISSKPVPGGEKGQYYFPVPLPPGEARFAVAYRVPYRGEAVMEPRMRYSLEQFVFVLPRSMKLEVKTGDGFRAMAGEMQAGVQVVTAAVKPGQPPAFRISGAGRLVEPQGQPQSAAGLRPAKPEALAGTPNPLHKDRWLFLGGLALVLAAGAAGIISHKRKQRQGLPA